VLGTCDCGNEPSGSIEAENQLASEEGLFSVE
jgi:hypothetical protein